MVGKDPLSVVDPEISKLIRSETERKEYSLELIASENCVSEAVLEACGSVMTDKYCEGYPGRRYYGGCQYYDEVERIAIDRLKTLFGVEAANVQPHSGSNANLAAFLVFLQPGDRVVGPRLDQGGHLSHGSPVNISGQAFNVAAYGINPDTGLYEEQEVLRVAKEHKPKLLVCGASAYARQVDFAMFRRVADEVGAVLMADIAHYAGLIAGGAYDSPVPFADIITSTTHKTLRGPRGGIIMTNMDNIKAVNKSVFPGLQGGPLMHQVTAKAVAFKEALQPEFKEYAGQVVANARRLGEKLLEKGFSLISGGTDSHMLLIDLRSSTAARDGQEKLTGKLASAVLGEVGITVNKNAVPNDPESPMVTSGFRVGTAALTSRGFGLVEMDDVAELIYQALEKRDHSDELEKVRQHVKSLCERFPLYKHRLVS